MATKPNQNRASDSQERPSEKIEREPRQRGVTAEMADFSLADRESDSHREVLRREVEKDPALKRPGYLDAAEKFAPELQQHREVLEQATGTIEDDEKLKHTLDRMQKFQNDGKKLKWLMGKKGGQGLSTTKQFFDAVAVKYVTDEGTEGKKKARMKTFAEVMGETQEKNGLKKVLQNLRLWVSHPVEFFKYLSVRSKRKELLTYVTLERIGGKCKDIADEALEKVDEAKVIADRTRETRGKLSTMHKERKLVASGSVENLASKSNKKFKNILEKIAHDGPEKFTEKISAEAQNTVRQVEALGPAGVRAVEQGRFHGLRLRPTGAGLAITFSILALKDAFHSLRKENFGEFKAKVTHNKWWSDMAEILPVVGSVQSYKRLNDFSTGLPQWARWAEFGINAGLDGLFIIPIGLGFVAGGVPGAALTGIRAAIGKVSTMGVKGIAKAGMKKGLQETAELGLKEAGKTGLKEGAEAGVEKGSVRVATREATREISKNIFQRMTPSNWKALWPHVRWQLGFEAIFAGAVWAWDNFAKQKTIEVSTNIALDQLSPQQRRGVEMVQKMRHSAATDDQLPMAA